MSNSLELALNPRFLFRESIDCAALPFDRVDVLKRRASTLEEFANLMEKEALCSLRDRSFKSQAGDVPRSKGSELLELVWGDASVVMQFSGDVTEIEVESSEINVEKAQYFLRSARSSTISRRVPPFG
jgi:hypothetical protein